MHLVLKVLFQLDLLSMTSRHSEKDTQPYDADFLLCPSFKCCVRYVHSSPYAESPYAECQWHSVFMLSVISRCVVMLSVILLYVIIPSPAMLSVAMLSVFMLSVFMLSVFMLSVIALLVIVPFCFYELCKYLLLNNIFGSISNTVFTIKICCHNHNLTCKIIFWCSILYTAYEVGLIQSHIIILKQICLWP